MTPTPTSGSPPGRPGDRKRLSLLLVPSYIAVLAVLYLVGGTAAFTDPITLLFLNTAFLGLIPLYVAYVSFVSFRRSGPVSVLMMGAGMLFFGLGSVAAGLGGFLPNSTNLTITLFNLGACAGAALQSAGALTALAGWREDRAGRRPAVAAATYAAVVLIFAGITVAALQALTPVFFAPGTGSTIVRDFVLATAIEFFLLASVLFFVLYRRRREDFFFWYAVGMAILGLATAAAVFIVVYGGAFNWAVRAGQYLGACYILVAFVLLQRRASSGNVPVQELLARFFGEAEAGYRQLFETAADAIVVVDHAYRVLLWNAAAERMFGYTYGEAVGMSFPDLVLGDGGPPPLEETAGAARELEARRRDGSRVPVEMTVSERDIGGEAITTCVIRDLTERRRADEALRRSNEELQRFAYVASHDLQEPLRSIVSFSQLLERRYRGRLDQDADEYIDFIVQGGNRMQALIQDLLQVSRVDTAARPLEPTDAAAVVRGALRLLAAPLRDAGATVTVGELPAVMADAAQLEQVFVNLVGNAVKYRREGVPPAVAISARRAGGMVEFAVADNGIGIEDEYFDRIFEMFRRLHTHDRYEGTGIGLAVVKRIVERHGGGVRVESVPGEGSTFLFTLPAA